MVGGQPFRSRLYSSNMFCIQYLGQLTVCIKLPKVLSSRNVLLNLHPVYLVYHGLKHNRSNQGRYPDEYQHLCPILEYTVDCSPFIHWFLLVVWLALGPIRDVASNRSIAVESLPIGVYDINWFKLRPN